MASSLGTNKIAVIGAAGNIGREVLQVLAEREVPTSQVWALAIGAGAGSLTGITLTYGDEDELDVHELTTFDFTSVDIVINAGTADVAQKYLRKVAEDGTLVIDMSGAFRTDPDVKPGVPEVNGAAIDHPPHNIIACPGPLATMLSLVIKPLHDAAVVTRVVASTYQSVSGAGRQAMDELFAQTRAVYVNDTLTKEQFAKQIAFNAIPQTSPFRDDGVAEDEFALAVEMKQLVDPKIKVAATSCYVSAFLGTGIAASIEFKNELDAENVSRILRTALGVTVVAPQVDEGYVTLVEVAGEDKVFVSRIRDDSSVDNGVQLWIAGDNMRKGSALNAVQIAERWSRRKLN